MYCDYHLHSSFSGDSDAPMEKMIQQGIRLGLPAMCFTEHLDPDFPEEIVPLIWISMPIKKSFWS